MTRVYNFGAGPGALPQIILESAREELLDWQQTGMSILEISHRSAEFEQLLAEAEQDFRHLLAIPAHYRVFFISAPARAQFAMIPLNLLAADETADYLITGIWSKLAYAEARKFSPVNIALDEEPRNYRNIAAPETWQRHPQAKYLYYTANETINGIEFPVPPSCAELPLVVDMTSSILSRKINVQDYGLIFAGAQKNIAPAGLTLVIVRDDLLTMKRANIPLTYDYQCFKDYKSLYYTPCVWSIYMAAKMFKWIIAQGGVLALEALNRQKAQLLYASIDQSDFYYNNIDKNYRSLMNVPFFFTATDADNTEATKLQKLFIEEAATVGLAAVKGHNLVGGLRASLYNAMPIAGVEALVSFMADFERRYG